ncbi:MAG: hypothetical protein Q4D93_03985 [Porphyromonas sp.]|nr:hypothetical protein [Porphyromonas sp.]
MGKGTIKTLLIATTIAVAAMLTSCGGTKAKTVAEQAVNIQIEAVKAYPDGNLNTLYLLLSSEDRDVVTPENFQKFYKLPAMLEEIFALIPESRQVFKASDFQEVVTENRAEVMFSMQMPNPDVIGQGVLSMSDLLLISGKRIKSLSDLPESVIEKVRADIAKNGVPTKKVPQTVTMVKEDGEWRLYLNLKENLGEGAIPTPFDIEKK